MSAFFAKHKYLYLLIFAFLYLITRLPGIYVEGVNPDGINWHKRSFYFFKAIRDFDPAGTYQEYHPGVTVMAVSGPPLFYFGNYLQSLGIDRDYSPINFLDYDYIAKVSVILAGLVLCLITLYFLKQILTLPELLVTGMFFLTEPFFLGVNRLYHLDFMLAMGVFLSVTLAFKFVNSRSAGKKLRLAMFFGTCLFTAFSILTKITGLVVVPFIFVMFLISENKLKDKLFSSIVFLAVTTVLIFLMWPALIFNTVPTFQAVSEGLMDVGINGARKVGEESVHKNLIFAAMTDETPWYFYILVLAYNSSPFLLVGIMSSVVFFCLQALKTVFEFLRNGFLHFTPLFIKRWDSYHPSYRFFVTNAFAFAYLIAVLSLAGKKLDRYIVLVFPFVFAMSGYVVSKLNKQAVFAYLFSGLMIFAATFYRFFPYFYVYANPLLGGVAAQYRLVGIKPFGVGIIEVFNHISRDAALTNKKMSILGPKSLEAVALNATVFKESRYCRCNYVVKFKGDLTGAPRQFYTDYQLFDVVYINGLDYWYLYRKR